MNAPIALSSAVSLILLAGATMARADSMPSESPTPLSTAPRAEVIADLQVWQRAGMDAMDAGDAGVDVFSANYRTAFKRYTALRRAPEFASLVARVARDRGESGRLAGE